MLIQLPRGSSDQPKRSGSEECTDFEAALRRDLATAPVISYEPTLGGWSKRALDLALTFVSAPVWLPMLLGAALWSKLRHPAPVFLASDRVGYGGAVFRAFSLRIAPPTAVIERLRQPGAPDEPTPANDWGEMASKAEGRRAKWRRAFEHLPQMFNVMRGEMSLVGPAPLAPEELDPLKTAKRYYLSARPGVVGVNSVADADEEEAGQYKLYTMCWSLSVDVLILWDALRGLRDRGELWKPSFRLKRARITQGEAPVRRRSSSVA